MNPTQRNIAPAFKTIDSIDILPSEKQLLSNNIPIHIINGGSQDVLKIEFIFEAGIWHQNSPLVASMANSMLNEGTTNYTASELAEKIDFYGAYIGFSTGKHDASISLYTLTKHIKDTLKITEDIIKNSTFPQKEFQTILLNKKQKYQINHQKTNVLAKDKFNELVYGSNHPYANTYDIGVFDSLDYKSVKEFYQKHYTPNNCKIIIAGKINQEILDLLEALFGSNKWPLQTNLPKKEYNLRATNKRRAFVEKKDAVQSSIRIGRPIFNKTHKDYTAMQLLNLVLGGYFGSRLMQNIREDKGYTYGINSFMISHLNAGHFAIVTEVGKDVCRNAIREIFKEIKTLREERIPEEELDLVKNYISGEMLRNLDSPFALSESLKGNLAFGFDNSYYQKFISELKKISPDQITKLANTYLQEKDLYLIVCGSEDSTNYDS
ncbi:M16 family metallopeptidase [Ancylomarina longa]|uniref:Insulinase family protein n=1 Tax=Ancylomarina longa TaxID=2487017 RepID=A0A434AU46_9BACT|nr:pitrilysin family protein [Ancylomarina longa]RUT77933.1 insulinase family protein [Ancylomarina longa]